MPDDRFNEYCEDLLVRYKRRNSTTLTRRLESLCTFLGQKGDVVQTMFGGSVKKGTYVTGLSDVDVLLIVSESSLVNQSPAKVIEYVRETIQHRLRQNTVSAGQSGGNGQLLRRDRDTDIARHTDQHWRRSDSRVRKHKVEQRGAA